ADLLQQPGHALLVGLDATTAVSRLVQVEVRLAGTRRGPGQGFNGVVHVCSPASVGVAFRKLGTMENTTKRDGRERPFIKESSRWWSVPRGGKGSPGVALGHFQVLGADLPRSPQLLGADFADDLAGRTHDHRARRNPPALGYYRPRGDQAL